MGHGQLSDIVYCHFSYSTGDMGTPHQGPYRMGQVGLSHYRPECTGTRLEGWGSGTVVVEGPGKALEVVGSQPLSVREVRRPGLC